MYCVSVYSRVDECRKGVICERLKSVVVWRAMADDDRTHLLFSLLDGLRLIIPQFSLDLSAPDHRHSVLIPGVYYVFYQPPETASLKLPPVTKAPRAMAPRRPRTDKPVKSPTKTKPEEPLEGLYDRRQVTRKQEVMKERRRALESLPRSAAKTYPICQIGGVTYILNPNANIIINLMRSAKLTYWQLSTDWRLIDIVFLFYAWCQKRRFYFLRIVYYTLLYIYNW